MKDFPQNMNNLLTKQSAASFKARREIIGDMTDTEMMKDAKGKIEAPVCLEGRLPGLF